MKNRRGLWILRGILMGLAFAIILGALVMVLWNNIAVTIFALPVITLGQAIGLLVLCKILFGGFGGWGRRGCGGPGYHGHWRHKMGERFRNMSPEERAKWKNEWKSYCGRYGCEDEEHPGSKDDESATPAS